MFLSLSLSTTALEPFPLSNSRAGIETPVQTRLPEYSKIGGFFLSCDTLKMTFSEVISSDRQLCLFFGNMKQF